MDTSTSPSNVSLLDLLTNIGSITIPSEEQETTGDVEFSPPISSSLPVSSIRSAQQTTIETISNTSRKIAEACRTSDHLLQQCGDKFNRHVMALSQIQSDMIALEKRVGNARLKAEQLKREKDELELLTKEYETSQSN
eukprot:Tbor_TRINITY_DN5529_c1_g1::TRINITY_DN5529_c1_g1_i15::g.12963::m.12963